MLNKTIIIKCIVIMLCTFSHITMAEVVPPLKRSLQLTGNFGELRTNHFHTGLDFRASIGTSVYSVDEGYVSRISVSAGGYGNALYITHPSGITSVYAHLNSFAPRIQQELERRQYELQYYAVDINFAPEELPVIKDEIVAYTGNRGSSGGPHLHFEIRDTKSENPLDPLNYYKEQIKDNCKPSIKAIAVIPQKGVINGKNNKFINNVVSENGVKHLTRTINAWGDIIVALKAFDYMDGMSNIYGVHYVKLYMDDNLIYSSHIDTLSFAKGRQINSYIDSEEWLLNRSLFMKSYIAPGNTLNFYDDCVIKNRGIIKIDEERIYKIRYEVYDYYGNKDVCEFEILGFKYPINEEIVKTAYNKEYKYQTENFSIDIPPYAMYEDWTPSYTKADTILPNNYSVIHTINPYYEGVDKNCIVSIKIDCDTLQDKTKYYMAQLHSVGKNQGKVKSEYISQYDNGWLTAKTKSLGDYVVKADLKTPTVKYHGVVAGEVRITVKDMESGIKYFRGEIEGKFVLFTYDIKDKIARYKIDTKRYTKGGQYEIKFHVVDNCGNKKESKFRFTY